jgi:hypothetical protein
MQLFAETRDIPAHPQPTEAYFDHPFCVPAGLSQLSLRLSYWREAPEWDVLLVVFDPDGHRGTFGLNATPVGPKGDVELIGQVAGAVPPGNWLAQVWAAHVNQPLRYTLHVEASDGLLEADARPVQPTVPDLAYVARSGPAWYQGELHTHTTFSDGVLPPAGLLDEARAAGAQFMAISDHNTIDAWPALAEIRDVCIIPALEITMPAGHCNLFGLRQWLDWRVDYRGRTMGEAQRDAREQGALVSINHPFAPGYSWHYDTEVALADCLEVVNYPSWWPAATEYNVMALGLWTSMLNAGHRLTAVGGSDVFHLPPGAFYMASPHPEAILSPATWVYAQNASALALMDGLRRGHAYVSMGPRLQFEARAGAHCYHMGEHIAGDDGAVQFDLALWAVPAGARLTFVKNGRVLAEGHPARGDVSYRFADTPDWQIRNWYRVDLFNGAGEIWAVTNPIYVGRPPSQPHETWGQALARARREGMIIEQTIFE